MKKVILLLGVVLIAQFAVASDVDLYKGLLFWIKDQNNIEGNELRQTSLPLTTVLDGSKTITFSGADLPIRDSSAFSFAVSFKVGELDCINRLFRLGSDARQFCLDAGNKLHYAMSGRTQVVNWNAYISNAWYAIGVPHGAEANSTEGMKLHIF